MYTAILAGRSTMTAAVCSGLSMFVIDGNTAPIAAAVPSTDLLAKAWRGRADLLTWKTSSAVIRLAVVSSPSMPRGSI